MFFYGSIEPEQCGAEVSAVGVNGRLSVRVGPVMKW